jgi:hypothetical protein
MSHSLTWQFLPKYLLDPLMLGAISLVEASELWDLMLQSPGEWQPIPPRLGPAVERILLLELEASETRH